MLVFLVVIVHRLPSSPYKQVKKESDSKRRSSEKTPSGSGLLTSEVKKEKRLGSLFSPEPETRPPTSLPHSSNNQRLPPSASSTALPDPLRTSNQQQARPGSSGEGSGDPVVNVQKLESIAPEFQQMLKEAPPSSILVTADGQPSPRKREEEKRKELEKRRQGEEKSQDKKRSTR